MKSFFSFYIALFLTCFFMLAVSVPNMHAGALGAVKEKTTGLFSNNSGNQTVVNVEKGDKDLETNEGKAYKESTITITADIIPFTMLTSMGGRQFGQDSFMAGMLYKVDEHWQGVLQVASLKHSSMGGVEYESMHYMAGIGLRWTFGIDLDQQIQMNGGLADSEIKRDGEVIEGFEQPAWFEAKYLWCADNTAWGLKMHVMDIPNTADNDEDYRNYGHVIISFNFEVGIK